MVRYYCKKCQAILETSDSMIGQQERCPECGALSVVPKPRNLKPVVILSVCAAVAVLVITGGVVLYSVLGDKYGGGKDGDRLASTGNTNPKGDDSRTAGPKGGNASKTAPSTQAKDGDRLASTGNINPKGDDSRTAGPKGGDASKTAPSTQASAPSGPGRDPGDVKGLIVELGFEFPKMVGYFYSFGADEGWLDYKCMRKADGATLTFSRRLSGPLDPIPAYNPAGGQPLYQVGAKLASEVGDVPDSGHKIFASHEEGNRKALLQLARKISPDLETGINERLADYDRTKRDSEQTAGKLSVSVSKDGLTVQSVRSTSERADQ